MSTSSPNRPRFLLLALGYIVILGVVAGVLLTVLGSGAAPAPAAIPESSSPTGLLTPLVLTETPTPFIPPAEANSPSTGTYTPFPILTELPTTEVPVVFAVIGDYGSGDRRAGDVAELVKSWQPDFIITTGDNNYPFGSAETIDAAIGQFYHDYIYSYNGEYGAGADQNRFFPVLGNHDWLTANARPYIDYFTLPGNEYYYDFTWGPLHFFALDGDPNNPDGVGSSSIQAEWLREGLAASTAPWKIVYVHQPPYSSGRHGSVGWMRWPFAEWGASVVMAGHDHTYERLSIDGLPYFVNGVGGGAIYDFNEILPESQVRFNADYGAMRVTASSTSIVYEFITRAGEVIDVYEVQR